MEGVKLVSYGIPFGTVAWATVFLCHEPVCVGDETIWRYERELTGAARGFAVNVFFQVQVDFQYSIQFLCDRTARRGKDLYHRRR